MLGLRPYVTVDHLGRNAADVAELELPRPRVVYRALLRVRQDLERLLDPPKHDRIPALVRVMHLGQAPKGLQPPTPGCELMTTCNRWQVRDNRVLELRSLTALMSAAEALRCNSSSRY